MTFRTILAIYIDEESRVGWMGAVEYTDSFSAEEYPHPLNECPGYDTKQSDDEASVMLELWRMQSTSLLPSLPGPL